MRGDRVRSHVPIVTGTIAALTLLVTAFEPAASWLELDRTALAAGEVWRIWTAHVAHWSGAHLAWDLGTFLCLGITVERTSRAQLLALLALSTTAISVCVLLLTPLDFYRGLSGIDAALFVVVALDLARARSRNGGRHWIAWIGGVALLGFLLKLTAEVGAGHALFVADLAPGITNVPLAHLVGAVTALGFRSLGAGHLTRPRKVPKLRGVPPPGLEPGTSGS